MGSWRRSALLVVLPSVVVLGSCSNDASAGTTAVPPPATSGVQVQAPAQPVATGPDAEALVGTLARSVRTLVPGTVYTDVTDPNGLLGQPGGYASKVAFTDRRIARKGSPEGVDEGGVIEVFVDAAAAQQRRDYIASVIGVGGMASSERLYLRGPALLRLSGRLTPSAAAGYARAWSALP